MLALVLQLAVAAFAAALVVTAVLPLSSSRVWWVRIWDFPRLHSAVGFALLVPLALVMPRGLGLLVAAVGLAGFAYQASWLRPFTRFARVEARFAPDAVDGVTLLSANVLQQSTRHDLVLRLIADVDPDVLLLMETDAAWIDALEPALARYPTVLRTPRDDCYGLAFATRLTADAAKVVRLTHDETPTVLAELRTAAGRPFFFLGLHPQPPTPDGADAEERDAQLIYAARFARRADVPLVAMGDFNEAAWSRGATEFKRVGGYVDPRVGRGLFASFNANHLMIRCPIDQIYVTADMAVVSITLGPHVGSDHFPMIARLRPEPEVASERNVPPPPLDPAEVTRLDELVDAYRDRLAKAELAAEEKRA